MPESAPAPCPAANQKYAKTHRIAQNRSRHEFCRSAAFICSSGLTRGRGCHVAADSDRPDFFQKNAQECKTRSPPMGRILLLINRNNYVYLCRNFCFFRSDPEPQGARMAQTCNTQITPFSLALSCARCGRIDAETICIVRACRTERVFTRRQGVDWRQDIGVSGDFAGGERNRHGGWAAPREVGQWTCLRFRLPESPAMARSGRIAPAKRRASRALVCMSPILTSSGQSQSFRRGGNP